MREELEGIEEGLSSGGHVRQPALAAVRDGWDRGRSGSWESVGQTLLQPPRQGWRELVEGGWWLLRLDPGAELMGRRRGEEDSWVFGVTSAGWRGLSGSWGHLGEEAGVERERS